MNTLIKSPSRLVNLLRADLAGVTPGVGSDMVANAPRVVPTVAALRALHSPEAYPTLLQSAADFQAAAERVRRARQRGGLLVGQGLR